jgi:polyhydroxybutyrate depolymerase
VTAPLVILALVVSAFASGGPGTPTLATPCSRPAVAGTTAMTLTSGGLVRRAVLHVPPRVAVGRRLPLVVALHGAGKSGPFMQRYSGLSTLADRWGFVVVYPSAFGPHPRWTLNDDNPTAPNDALFVRDLLVTLEARVCVDRTRVYAAGVSNGGGLAARLACVLSGRFAAVASVAGSYASITPCEPSRPVSVLEMHGTADASVPYGNVADFLQGWIQRDHCPSQPVQTSIAADAERFDWQPCAAGSALEHVRIDGGPHAWPGATPPDPGSVTSIAASQVVWDFFRAHTRAP